MIFYKYHGTGNDFILVNNMDLSIQLTKDEVSYMCERHFGIGADGLILLEPHDEGDFYMRYFNSDGSTSTMCGNGGRCAVKFARDIEVINKDNTKFFAADGAHLASILDNGDVALKMNVDPNYQLAGQAYIFDTGSPHYVRFIYNLDHLNVKKEGRIVRNSAQFKKNGINVNFVEESKQGIFVRTYERGVEDETLSCGTGVTAASLAYFYKNRINKSTVVNVETLGGPLKVQIELDENNQIHRVWLIGPAQDVFKGEIEL